MVAAFSVFVFVGAFLAAAGVMFVTVAPQWRRIVRLASGHIEPAFAPLSQLASAERRIAVRRWASGSMTADGQRFRAAA